MSNIKPRHSFASEQFPSFEGLRDPPPFSKRGAVNMKNFRILADGSLQKRGGRSTLVAFSDELRGFWEGSLEGAHKCFAVAGARIFELSPDEGRKTLIGYTSGTEKEVGFFLYDSRLYLQDGQEITLYHSSTNTFEDITPYIPQLGVNWHPTQGGELLESPNLLTDRMRVGYYNSTGTDTFILPFYATAVDTVRANNVAVTFDFTANTNKVVLTEAPATGATVEIAFRATVDASLQEQLRQCNRSFLFRNEMQEMLLLYGASQGYRVFCSKPVAAERAAYSRVFDANSTALYITAEDELLLGDSEHPVAAMCRNHDRVLAMTAEEGYTILFDDSGKAQSYPVLHGIGATSHRGLLHCENHLLCVDSSGVYRLSSTVGHPDDFTVERYPIERASAFAADFFRGASGYFDRMHGELWLWQSSDSAGRVLVYRPETAQSYAFDCMTAVWFADTSYGVILFGERKMQRMDDTLHQDNGNAITAYYQSGYLTFSHPEEWKRSLSLSVDVLFSGSSSLSVSLETERTSAVDLFGGVGETPLHFDRRIPLGRFRFLRFRLTHYNNSDCRISALALYATR